MADGRAPLLGEPIDGALPIHCGGGYLDLLDVGSNLVAAIVRVQRSKDLNALRQIAVDDQVQVAVSPASTAVNL